MTTPNEPAGREQVLEAITTQVGWCRRLGSPFSADVLDLVHANVAAGGALAPLVVPWSGPVAADAVALRLAGALHALVRSGRAPRLATFYPSAPQAVPLPPSPRAPWDARAVADAIEAAVVAERAFVADFLTSPPQTNEVGRSAILMTGYAEVARRTGLPLRVLELGASAGLNLWWDRWAYRIDRRTVGPLDAPLTLAPEWRGSLPLVTALPTVTERRGCDWAPIDLGAPGAADRLIAYVWPDQVDRLERLQAAIAFAQAAPRVLDAADAADWLEQHLARATPGVATVVAHTIAWQYFPRPTKERAKGALAAAGARATADRPLAWLAFEQTTADGPPELSLRFWPGGERRLLARAHPHGAWVEWVG